MRTLIKSSSFVLLLNEIDKLGVRIIIFMTDVDIIQIKLVPTCSKISRKLIEIPPKTACSCTRIVECLDEDHIGIQKSTRTCLLLP